MVYFEQGHQEIIEGLVFDSLQKASGAMEKMLKIRITSKHVQLGRGRLLPNPDFDQLGRFKMHVVRVRLKGPIGGAFYFLINGHEVDLINQVCLPKQLYARTLSENKHMKHGFMSEIENMIAALVIGDISESLGVQLLNDVPEIQIMPGDSVNTYLMNENILHKTDFHVSAVLTGRVVNIAPYFIWMLNSKFLEILRLNIVK